MISSIQWTKRWLELLKKAGDWRHKMTIARAEAMLSAGQALLAGVNVPPAPVEVVEVPEPTTARPSTPSPTGQEQTAADDSPALADPQVNPVPPAQNAKLLEINYGLTRIQQRFQQRESIFKVLESIHWTDSRIRDFESNVQDEDGRKQAIEARETMRSLRDRAAQVLISDITYGLQKFEERQRANESPATLRNTISWTELRLRELKRLNDPASRAFTADAEQRLQQARTRVPAAAPSVPYLGQLNNTLNPYGTCQNTSIAMTLRAYGWQGTPDDLTREFGNGLGKEPNGVAEIINTIAARNGLKIKAVPHTQATPTEFRESISRGPVVTHG
ncbi:MAG TPA: hypothetical protein PKO06_24170, partial [Candidatus Ozemobacteraceae bacterium]|nr:hypothetical protein [Candidatus Ozemobacteraceae bacterium]